MSIIISYLVFINIFAFIIFGIDKYKAKNHRWRIPEKTLFILAGLGGAAGALAGMYVFHHKTRHKKFKWGIPVLLILLFAILMFVILK